MGKPAALAAGVGTSKSDTLQGNIIKKRCRTSEEPYAMMQEEPFDILRFKGALASASASHGQSQHLCAGMGKPAALAAGVGTSWKARKKRRRTSGEPYAMMPEEPDGILCFKGALANASADTMDSGGETEASHKSAEAAEVASHSGCASGELQ